MSLRIAILTIGSLLVSITAFAFPVAGDDDAIRAVVLDYYSAYEKQDIAAMQTLWNPDSPFFKEEFQSISANLNSGKEKISGPPHITSTHIEAEVPRVRFEIIIDGKTKRLTAQFMRVGDKWRIGHIVDSITDLALDLGRLLDRNEQRRLLNDSPELKTSELLDRIQRHLFTLTNFLQFDSAMSLADLGIEVAQELKDDKNRLRIAIRRSTVFEQSGETAKAVEALFGTIDLARSIGDRQLEGMSMYYMSRALGIMGDRDGASEYLRKAAVIADEVKNQSLTNQVLNLQALNMPDPNDRLKANAQLLENVRKGNNRYGEAGVLGNIAQCYSDLGDQQKAIEILTQALKIFDEIGAVAEPIEGQNMMSTFYERAGRLTEALEWAERSHASAEKAKQGGYSSNRQLFRVYLKLGRFADARRVAEKNVAVNEEDRGRVLSDEGTQTRFLQERAIDYQNLIQVLGESGTPLEALQASELFKARTLFDVVNSGKGRQPIMLSPAERIIQDGLANQLALANRVLVVERQREFPNDNEKAKAEAAVEKARREMSDFRLRLFAGKPELKARRGEFQPVGIDELTRLIPNERTALLEFAVTEDKSFGYLVTAKGGKVEIRVFPIAITRDQLSKQINKFRSKLQNADLSYMKESRELFSLLLSPVSGQLRGIDDLIIVPASILWDIPFQALSPSNGRYLIEDVSIEYAPSLTALSEIRKHTSDKFDARDLLAFADPVIGETQQSAVSQVRGDRLEPLPAAKAEVNSIASLFGHDRAHVFQGSQATEAKFRELAGGPGILHFATHGVLSDRDPMFSSLVLASSGGAKDDGLLEAWEISGMKLNAGLAVLSACETARGLSTGEGLIGLSWSFFVAGVPRVVASQWKVESNSTADLMRSFYKDLRTGKGASVSRSLQRAMIGQIKKGGRRHPFYWAGFVSIGG